MLLSQSPNYFSVSVENSKKVVSGENLYNSLRTITGNFLAALLLGLLLPLVLWYGFALRNKRRRFREKMRNERELSYDSKSYLKLKKTIDELGQYQSSLEKLKSLDVKKYPWVFRFTLSQMKKMSITLTTYYKWLNNHLKKYNEERYSKGELEFAYLPEKKLWEERNKNYEYWT